MKNAPLVRSALQRYLVCVVLVGATLLFRLLLGHFAGRPALILFVIPVLSSSYLAGLGPGLLATVLSVMASIGLVLPPAGYSMRTPLDWLQVATLALTGILFSFLMEASRRSESAARAAERRESELALRETQSRWLRDFAKDAPIGIVFGAADGSLHWANDEYLRVIGYSRQEFEAQGVRWDELAPPEWIREDRRAIADLPWVTCYEKEYLRRDGPRVPVLLGLTGQKNGLAAFVLDLTQEKKVQSELREAERALREAGRRKDEFLGVLSHELRNPLAPIRNSLYLLERTPPLDERARRAVEIIGRQTAHLSRLIDDLLDVTRISSGKIRLRMARLDLVQLLSKTADDLSWVFGTAGLKLDIDLPEQPLWVDGDATRLSQIAGNLLSNASKFTPRGGTVRLAARVECHSAEAPAALIEVADTGTGIEPSMLPQMFQPFSQAERTVERSGGGLGLGLALVKGLVELHGGRVSVTSAGTGQGACFLVALPLAGPPAARAAPVRTPKGREGPRRILVVEDNRDAAESLRTALELNHHVVEVASDGPEGLSKAQQFKPDIVLCDIGLPGFDGYELARRLRALGQFRSVPLVAISGYGRPSDVRQAAEAGFQQHLTKPPDLVAVERLVETSGP